ncbi:hypothetical protein DERF_004745 [Dermatophagoides farinae]|uniref:Uncharacterized protein n=1 Tax=Dermatophagoides farinae TaxID=6954 RepID=A0A922L5J0_DERFA|nr:hypothetical protein DERF_004745 [Dermatophagoides farinae]
MLNPEDICTSVKNHTVTKFFGLVSKLDLKG